MSESVMSDRCEPSVRPGQSGEETDAGQPQPLAIETEFDGLLRPHAPSDMNPCDPARYWEFFSSGTD